VLLEPLALIAYRQPIMRSEIEAVRGLTVSSDIVRTLLERSWVRVVGHRELPGRPELLGTTREFLDYFGLRTVDELPPLAELRGLADINPQLVLPVDAEGEAQGAAPPDLTLLADDAGDLDDEPPLSSQSSPAAPGLVASSAAAED
jgi:segregation and condensation protein B